MLATRGSRRKLEIHADMVSRSKVQETDGSFFEAFASLPWRQENRRMQSLKEEEEQKDRPPPSEAAAGLQPKRVVVSQQERENLYVEVLYTVKHKVGATTSEHSSLVDELNDYTQEAFHFSRDEHQRMMTIASDEKPPIVILNLVVVEASGLEAKDADGFSDPYCMLGIVPGAVSGGDRSTPPGSPRVSRSSHAPPAEEDGEERQLNTHADKLRKHHSFRLSFKRKPESRPSVVSSPSSAGSGGGGGGCGREGHRDSLSHAVPAKFIRATTVKPNTLDPRWEEKFRLDHDDETSVLDAVSKLNEVKGVRGMARFFKQVAQSARSGSGGQDDFLGCVNISLQDIPSTGLDQWFTLEGRTSKSAVQGRIRLKMWLSTREDRGVSEEDTWSEVIQQQKLFELFVKHELSKYRGPSYRWSGELPTPATTILHQHAVQGDLTELQQAVCRWIAYAEQHQETSLDYRLLLKILKQLNDKFTQDALTYEEQESLAESFKTTLAHCFAVLRKLRKLFPAGNKEAHRKLDSLLKFLAAFSGMEIFRRVLPFQKEIRSEIIQTVKKGCVEWYGRLREQQQLDPSGDDAAVLQSLIKLVNEVCSHCFQAYNHHNQLFMQSVSVPFFATIYKQLEKLVSADIQDTVGRLCSELQNSDIQLSTIPDAMSLTMGTATFELYMATKDLYK
ncbi:BAI1-associated protein 3 [Amphibalanus amphitrite]|uniref:BAI1-associated protein 3 n=1 Tax=Amphibalanus amphitrite TaxID=1232801 RepID=A0A6A4W8Z0_AMPAM|nr:BAI1-associated protein 3 [Amphibalanus amphitrite]